MMAFSTPNPVHHSRIWHHARQKTYFSSRPSVNVHHGPVLPSIVSLVAGQSSHVKASSPRISAKRSKLGFDISSEEKPGLRESSHFTDGEFVDFWKRYDRVSNPTEFAARQQSVIPLAVLDMSSNPQTASYMLYCLGRTAFFGILFMSGNAVAKMLFNSDDLSSTFAEKQMLFIWDEAWHTFSQDLIRIRSGVYKMPWDVNLNHRQFNPFHVAPETFQNLLEIANMAKKVFSPNPDIDVWLRGKIYPDYYAKTFHYQTDGWLSSQSADSYEGITEALFFGRQDAMQRLTLCALSSFFKTRDMRPGQAPLVIEVAAGTGRFSTFVRDNWPGANLVITDLSPFYLLKARENMAYWERMTDTKKTKMGSVRYIHAAGEDIPFRDASVDVLYNIYLFHELPPQARKDVVDEAARVLKPGGLFVITDSVQMGDRLKLDEGLANFSGLNEPWYTSYVMEDLTDIATRNGKFLPKQKEVCSVTKMLSFSRTSL